MKAGWLQFGRKRASVTAASPDNAVTAPPAWLLATAIVCSTAALLGTSDVDEPRYPRTYTFARSGVDGGFVELTRDQPAATFIVSLHADDLAADGVPSTDEASALVDGTITTTGLDEGKVAPYVDVQLSTPGGAGTQKVELEHFNQAQPIYFTGDCENPKASGSCTAHFAVAVSRQDQGESGGVVRFDWTFDVTSKVLVDVASQEASSVGPVDPPWTIEVSQP